MTVRGLVSHPQGLSPLDVMLSLLWGDYRLSGLEKSLIGEIERSGVVIEEPKCNFDVEIAMDIMDDLEKVSAIMLFSGDSDFASPLERVKLRGKHVYVVGVRGMVAAELHKVKDEYFDFGKLYTGARRYQNAKIPSFDGTA